MRLHHLAAVFALGALALPPPAHAQFTDLINKARKAASTGQAMSPSEAGQQQGRGGGLGELVVSPVRPTSFADAKSKAVTTLSDGQEIWVAIKLDKPLAEYSLANLHAGQPEFYELQIDVTPANDRRAYNSCFWLLTPQEAARDELVVGLGPVSARSIRIEGGRYTKETKLSCWLRTVGEDDAKPGVWRNRVALISMNPNNGTADAVIAASPLTANVPSGFPLWNRMKNQSDRCEPRNLAKGPAPFICPK